MRPCSLAPSLNSKYDGHAKRGFFMHPFLSAVIGGALIGFSVVLLMFLSGRIAGISGIVGGLLPPRLADDWRLRLAFVAGLLLSPLILNCRMRSDAEENPIAGQHARPAVIETRLQRSRRHKAPGPHDQLGAGHLVVLQMQVDLAVDHL